MKSGIRLVCDGSPFTGFAGAVWSPRCWEGTNTTRTMYVTNSRVCAFPWPCSTTDLLAVLFHPESKWVSERAGECMSYQVKSKEIPVRLLLTSSTNRRGVWQTSRRPASPPPQITPSTDDNALNSPRTSP